LAEGPSRAAERIGRGAEALVIAVKGQPFPMHECRLRHGQALGYAVSPTGADHMHNMWDEGLANSKLGEDWQGLGIYEPVPRTELNPHKVRAYIARVHWQWLRNHLGICMFPSWSREQVVDMIRAITGWQTNLYELLKVAERGVTMARVFNMRHGLTRADDVLPPRMATSFVSGTINEEPVVPGVLDATLTDFYGMMGWDPQTGEPTEAKLNELDIAWVKQVDAPQAA
jgi:aldehyde:ferredoxin oxidoreductase